MQSFRGLVSKITVLQTCRSYSSGSNASLFSIENVLSDDNKANTIAKFSTMKPIRRINTEDTVKRAAVLVPLCVVNNKVSLLYTKRAPNLKTHRGQVSFPGGVQDIKDTSLEETALRETQEELGIDQDDIDLWGRGAFIVQRKEMGILPVAGVINFEFDIDAFTLNPSEVEEIFTVTLEDLCNPANQHYTQFRSGYSTPVFITPKHRIWGLTALITHLFLRSLLPPKAYSHKIKYLQTITSTVNLRRKLVSVQ